MGCPAHCKSITRSIPRPSPKRAAATERCEEAGTGLLESHTPASLCIFPFGKHKEQLTGAQLSVHITHLQRGTPRSILGLCVTWMQGAGSGPSGHPGAHQALAAPLLRHGKQPGLWGGEGGERKKGTHCSGVESGKLHGPPGAKPGGNPGSEHGSLDPPGDLWAGNYSWKTNSPFARSLCPLGRGTASLSHGPATSSPRTPCPAAGGGVPHHS